MYCGIKIKCYICIVKQTERDTKMKNTNNTNTKIAEVTKTINYKGYTITQGWDEWGQKTTLLECEDGQKEFWSIADAKKYINGQQPRVDMTAKAF